MCVWIATCILIGFSLQMNLVGGLSLSDCEDYQFKLNKDNKCRDCPACPAGQEYTVHCGREEKNGIITKPKKGCEDCPPNYYKSRKSSFICVSCKAMKCQEGAEMIHPCNKTHDLKCKCKKGFYTASDGSCVRCSPCCGNPSVYGRKFAEKECENAGMGSCSCRPLQNCQDKTRVDCKKGFLTELSTENPPGKTPSPTTMSTPKKVVKNNTTMKPKSTITQQTTISGSQGHKDERKEEEEQNFVTGWLVATVIAIVLVLAIFFHMLKRFNILKKIKFLLKPRQQVEEDVASHSVITVEERYESPARPANPNYAQRMLPEEDMESQSDHIQQRLGAIPNRCTVSASDLDDDEIADLDPWVYRDSIWPLTRAKVALNPAYGEYIEILRNEDAVENDCLSTQGNNSGSLQQLDEVITNELPPQTQDKKEVMKVQLDNKPGQERSDSEEPPTSIPATASGENTVIVATGQHRGGVITDEFAIRNEFSKGKQDTGSSDGKRRKKQSEKKRKTRKPPDNNSKEREDILRCTCGDCSYRPYLREKQLCHCTDCVPQPMDDLYNIIERQCLRAEICKELNKKGVPNWRELCTYIRIDKDITRIEKEENPAEIVLEKLKSSRPRLKLEDFSYILNRIKRQDIRELIVHHHITCMLCRRNSFDGSLVNLHVVSEEPSTTLIASKISS